jgi:hypothetical protein
MNSHRKSFKAGYRKDQRRKTKKQKKRKIGVMKRNWNLLSAFI